MSAAVNKLAKTVLGLVFISMIHANAFGQFEQKLTVNASGAMVYPDMLETSTIFGMGYGIDGGLMFNFSLFGNARFYYMFGAESYEDAYLDNMAFGGGLKMNLLPARKINPYLFVEANVNLMWIEEWIVNPDASGYYDSDFGTSMGGLGGVGLDFKLNENISLFGQSAAYYTHWDGRLNLYSQLGVRLNMIKSKTI
jgi:hypothetical protein